MDEVTFADGMLIGAREGGEHTKILRWKDGALAPDVLESLTGSVLSITAAPMGPLIAVVLATQRGDASASKSLLVIDVHSGALTPLFTDETMSGQDEPPVWSPDGRQLAIGTIVGEKAGIVRVLDVSKRTVVATASCGALPDRWTSHGLLLRSKGAWDAPKRTSIWFPSAGDPSELEVPKQWDSPDGRFTITIENDAIRAGESKFEPSRDADREAIADLIDDGPRWIGPHALELASDDLFMLDVETMRLRYLTNDPSIVRVIAASADGKRAVGEGAIGALVLLH